jgi:hypothetical protein
MYNINVLVIATQQLPHLKQYASQSSSHGLKPPTSETFQELKIESNESGEDEGTTIVPKLKFWWIFNHPNYYIIIIYNIGKKMFVKVQEDGVFVQWTMDPPKPELILTNEKFKVTDKFVQEYYVQFIDIENAEFLIVTQEQLVIIDNLSTFNVLF